jgi:hypothetical protein
MNIRIYAMAAVLLGALTACAIPKVMIGDEFVPNQAKVARSSVKLVGDVGGQNNRQALMNYYIQICDVKGTAASNCKTTLVLENITNYQGAVSAYRYR